MTDIMNTVYGGIISIA